MKKYIAPFYTESQLDELEESQVHFPYSNKNATYVGEDHQYELTPAYFLENGINLEMELDGEEPEKVRHWLRALRQKVYLFIYSHSQSDRRQMNYLIAKRGLRGWSMEEYRKTFLEAMFLQGKYLLANGDLSTVSGVDLDTMQNMSGDVMRDQNRDMHRDCIRALNTLGCFYTGRYKFVPQGEDW